MDEKWGKRAFWLWLVGFYVAFMPLYVLGFLGMTRRMNHYSNPAWHPWLLLAEVGAILIAAGIACQIAQIVVTIRDRSKLENLDLTGDPWDGRTLEWSTTSPPPFYNFAVTPQVHSIDAFAAMKENPVLALRPRHFADIHMPHNTSVGLIIGVLSFVLGFGLIWHIWWMAAAAALAILGSVIVRSFDNNTDYIIPASEVARMEEHPVPDMTLETAN